MSSRRMCRAIPCRTRLLLVLEDKYTEHCLRSNRLKASDPKMNSKGFQRFQFPSMSKVKYPHESPFRPPNPMKRDAVGCLMGGIPEPLAWKPHLKPYETVLVVVLHLDQPISRQGLIWTAHSMLFASTSLVPACSSSLLISWWPGHPFHNHKFWPSTNLAVSSKVVRKTTFWCRQEWQRDFTLKVHPMSRRSCGSEAEGWISKPS